MNKFLVIIKRPLIALLLFLVFQTMAGFVVLAVQMFTGSGNIWNNASGKIFDAQLMGIATLACNVLLAVSCLALFRRSLYTNNSYAPSTTSWKRSLVALGGCILGTIAMNLLSELIALPNIMEEQMLGMCREPWGILAIAIGAPLGEEVMFRWGIMGHMLRGNCSAQAAIAVSAVFFGLLHINPVQVFFATAMGIMLGILYWRSGNLFWPFLLHLLNNSVACLQVWMLGDKVKEYSIVDAIGGTSYAWVAIAILLMAASAILWWYITGDRNKNKNRNNTLRWK